MKVRMSVALSGTRDGADWPPPGAQLDVPDDEGASLCAAGLAVPVKVEPERAVASPAETRARKPVGRSETPPTTPAPRKPRSKG